MKKIKVLMFFSFCCSFSKSYCQFFQTEYYNTGPFSYEVGAGIGVMNCITDLGGANDNKGYYVNEMRLKNFKPSSNIFAGIMFRDYVGAKLQGSWGQIQSADADVTGNSIDDVYRRNRNLSFRSRITEVALLLDLRPLILFSLEPAKWAPEPYLTAGIGWFSFRPQTLYNGSWVDLKPLHTEGEGFPEYPDVHDYKLSQVNIPVGIGLRYKVSSKLNVRLEYVHRILFTDYLDDAGSPKFINPNAFDKNLPSNLAADAKALYNRSINGRIPPTRANPNNKDAYMSLILKLGVTIGHEY